MKRLTEKQFALKKEELRKYIQESVSPFPKGFPETKAQRIARGAFDKEYFFRTYLPHYFYQDPAKIHKEMHELADLNLVAIQAPRGFAKSTHLTFGEIIYDICYAKEHYVLIVAVVKDLAEDFSRAIKLEFEENPRIIHDFGKLKTAEWLDDEFVTANGIKVESLGSGQKPRGRKFKQYRVTKVVGDDLEDDEQARNPERTDKLENWLFSAVYPMLEPDYERREFLLPAGTEDYILAFGSNFVTRERRAYRVWERGAKMILVGTLLATDSLLARLLDAEKHTEWIKRDFHALENGKSVWPARWPLEKLEATRRVLGEERFAQEYMGQPPDKSVIRMREEDLRFFDDGDYDLDRLPKYGALDPSLGKERSDYQAISCAAVSPDNIILVFEGLALREPPLKLCDRVVALQSEHRFIAFGVETVAFQEVLKDILEEKAAAAKVWISIRLVEAVIAKDLRIEKLPPLIKSGRIKFHKKLKGSEYIRCFINWRPGKSGKDDPPDSLEMLTRIIATGPIDVRTKPKKETAFGISARADMSNFV